MAAGTTLRRAVIFHGYGATPADHWFGWLAAQLDADGVQVDIPALPRSLDPDRDSWQRSVATVLGTPDEDTAVVAHSLGCLAVLRHLAGLPRPWRLGTLVLVAGFVDPLAALPELDSFIAGGCDTTTIGDRVDRLVVLRSDDDPVVPPASTDRLADLLGVRAQVVAGAGHFLATDGFTAIPEVRDVLVPARDQQ